MVGGSRALRAKAAAAMHGLRAWPELAAPAGGAARRAIGLAWALAGPRTSMLQRAKRIQHVYVADSRFLEMDRPPKAQIKGTMPEPPAAVGFTPRIQLAFVAGLHSWCASAFSGPFALSRRPLRRARRHGRVVRSAWCQSRFPCAGRRRLPRPPSNPRGPRRPRRLAPFHASQQRHRQRAVAVGRPVLNPRATGPAATPLPISARAPLAAQWDSSNTF